MTIDQTTSNESGESGGGPSLVLRADDGTAYAIPQGVVEAHRLSDEQRAELDARLAAIDSDDTAGHQFIGTFPPFVYVRWAPTNPFAAWQVTVQQGRDARYNPDANYYPPLR